MDDRADPVPRSERQPVQSVQPIQSSDQTSAANPVQSSFVKSAGFYLLPCLGRTRQSLTARLHVPYARLIGSRDFEGEEGREDRRSRRDERFALDGFP